MKNTKELKLYSDNNTRNKRYFSDMVKFMYANIVQRQGNYNLVRKYENYQKTDDQHKSTVRGKNITEQTPKHLKEIDAFKQKSKNVLKINVDSETKEVKVKIIDSKTGDVIRQIPIGNEIIFKKYTNKLNGSFLDKTI